MSQAWWVMRRNPSSALCPALSEHPRGGRATELRADALGKAARSPGRANPRPLRRRPHAATLCPSPGDHPCEVGHTQLLLRPVSAADRSRPPGPTPAARRARTAGYAGWQQVRRDDERRRSWRWTHKSDLTHQSYSCPEGPDGAALNPVNHVSSARPRQPDQVHAHAGGRARRRR